MPRKFHQLSKGEHRERKRRPRALGRSETASAPVAQGTAGPPSPGAAAVAAGESRPQASPPTLQRTTTAPGVHPPSGRAHVYLTPEAKHLGREFRNIIGLTAAMTLVILVVSFFLR